MNVKDLEKATKELLESMQMEIPLTTKTGRKIPTPIETIEAAYKCTTREQADKLVEDICDILAEATDSTPYKYEETIRSAIGKECVSMGPEISQRMFELFDAKHPVFGPPDVYWNMTMKQMHETSNAWGKTQAEKANEEEKAKKEGLKTIQEKLDRLKKGLSAQAVEETN